MFLIENFKERELIYKRSGLHSIAGRFFILMG